MEFEWDKTKDAANIAKHGLSFSQVTAIFDGFCVYARDSRYDYGEQRFLAIGALEAEAVVVVVFTYRGEKLRIISARPANKSERRHYYEAIR